jgi:hypothetical protein
VVVLPLVPVTPMSSSDSAGSPYTWAAARPSTPRTLSATSTGRPVAAAASRPSGSVRIAAAPFAAAWAANSAPCARAPGSAA